MKPIQYTIVLLKGAISGKFIKGIANDVLENKRYPGGNLVARFSRFVCSRLASRNCHLRFLGDSA